MHCSRKGIKIMALIMLVFLFFNSLFSVNAEENAIIRIGGSTTLLPIIASSAKDFMDKYVTWDKIDPKLSKENIVIFITGGGSGFGVGALQNGVFDIGLVSRDLKEKEKSILGEYQTYMIAKDAIAIAANKNTPLKKRNFNSVELAQIFSGEIRTFKELESKAPAKEIILFVRDASAGSAEIFQEKIMKEKQISPNSLQLPSQGALLQKLGAKKYGIGYISSGLVNQNKSIISFSLDGVSPTNDNVINGSYKLSRPLYMVIKGKPNIYIQKFISYVLNEGQKIVVEAGYIPMKEIE